VHTEGPKTSVIILATDKEYPPAVAYKLLEQLSSEVMIRPLAFHQT
jgi:hypothetical protein